MAGKSFNDLKLAGRVRTKLLNEAERILDKGTDAEKKDLLYRMCGTLLPRLQEHTGADGEKLNPLPLLNGKSNECTGDNSYPQVTCA